MRFATIALCALAGSLSAQVAQPNGTGVSMGHLHLLSADPAGQRRFWVDGFGARPAKLGPLEVLFLPGVVVMVNRAAPAAGSDGSVINHGGLLVRDLKTAVGKAIAAGASVASRGDKQAMLVGPGGFRLELTEDQFLAEPVRNHHIHLYVPDAAAARQWYAAMFGAKAGMRGKFLAADLPGVNLSFSPSDQALAGTKGRVLDHIGFEVSNLKAFARKLEGQGVEFAIPYREVPELGIGIAFLTDPWGTYIELTEGLSSLR